MKVYVPPAFGLFLPDPRFFERRGERSPLFVNLLNKPDISDDRHDGRFIARFCAQQADLGRSHRDVVRLPFPLKIKVKSMERHSFYITP